MSRDTRRDPSRLQLLARLERCQQSVGNTAGGSVASSWMSQLAVPSLGERRHHGGCKMQVYVYRAATRHGAPLVWPRPRRPVVCSWLPPPSRRWGSAETLRAGNDPAAVFSGPFS